MPFKPSANQYTSHLVGQLGIEEITSLCMINCFGCPHLSTRGVSNEEDVFTIHWYRITVWGYFSHLLCVCVCVCVCVWSVVGLATLVTLQSPKPLVLRDMGL